MLLAERNNKTFVACVPPKRDGKKVNTRYVMYQIGLPLFFHLNPVAFSTNILTLFRMGFFGAAHGLGGSPPSLKSYTCMCHTYPTMMKLYTVRPYQKKSKKYINHMTHPLSSADITIFSPEICKFLSIKKYRYNFRFDKKFVILVTFLESLKIVSIKMIK